MLVSFYHYQCDATNYCGLTLGLSKLGIWPAKSQKNVFCSVEHLVLGIENMKRNTLTHHLDCSNHLYNNLTTATKTLSKISPVLDSHLLYMRGQRGEEKKRKASEMTT